MDQGSWRRPNRSDIHLSVEDEAKIEEKTRDYFDGNAPKRHTKPQRSEYSTQYVDSLPPAAAGGGEQDFSPEYVEFQRLESDPTNEKLINDGGGKITEEFVETEYYNDLNCIDRQHHTTGTGFIRMEDSKGFSLVPDPTSTCHASCKGNPATNDWIPAAASDTDNCGSCKPNRSDS